MHTHQANDCDSQPPGRLSVYINMTEYSPKGEKTNGGNEDGDSLIWVMPAVMHCHNILMLYLRNDEKGFHDRPNRNVQTNERLKTST